MKTRALRHKITHSTKSVSFLNSFFSSLVGMLSFMALARLLNLEEFGFWAFFLSVFTMFDMLRSGLLSSATVKYYTEGVSKENLIQIEKSVLQLGTWITFITFLFPLIYFGMGLNKSQPELLAISIGVVPLSFISTLPSVATWFAQAKQSFTTILKIRLITQLSFLLIILSGYAWDIDLNGVFYAYFASSLIAAIWTVITRRIKLQNLVGESGSWRKTIFNFGRYAMGTLLGSNMLRNSDTYLIMGFLNAASVAMYNVPNRIMALLDIPIQAFSSADFPRFVALVNKNQSKELQETFNKGLGISMLVVWPSAIFVFIFSKWLVVLIAGVQYENSFLILRIFAIYAMLLPIDRYSGIMLDALGRPQKNLGKVMTMLLSNLILDLIVLSLGYGVNAVVMVSLLTYGVGIIFGFSAIRDQIKFQIIASFKAGFHLAISKIRR